LPTTTKTSVKKVKRTHLICDKCNHEWYPRRGRVPKICPQCKRVISHVGNVPTGFSERAVVPLGTVARVFERDNKACVRCKSTEALEIDHIIPCCAGGTNDEGNLQVLCRSCNKKKGKHLSV